MGIPFCVNTVSRLISRPRTGKRFLDSAVQISLPKAWLAAKNQADALSTPNPEPVAVLCRMDSGRGLGAEHCQPRLKSVLAQAIGAIAIAQLRHDFALNLAYTLAREAEAATNLIQGARNTIIEAVA